MGNFLKDLKRGHKAEQYVIKQLGREHENLHAVEGSFKDYDLIADDGYTAEVKYDELSEKTGNVGFEYECYGKESGVASTKAFEWVHIYKLNRVWVYSTISTNSLKSFLKANWKYLDKVKGGDNNASKMVLLSASDLADSFGFKFIL